MAEFTGTITVTVTVTFKSTQDKAAEKLDSIGQKLHELIETEGQKAKLDVSVDSVECDEPEKVE